MRIALRQRPLPADVGGLIELASGEPGRLARVAASQGEAPERVLEAARFYVREVLLFAGADAYRVLGVAPGASGEEIKLHHRLLQHWLHPDRRGNDWESAFATRINAAWAELRSPERRAAYEARQPSAGEGSRRMLVNQWRPAPQRERRSLGWLVVGASAICCAWLLVLVDRQATAPAPEWNPTRPEAATPATTSLAGSFHAVLENAGVLPEPAPSLPRELAVPPAMDRDSMPSRAPAIAKPSASALKPSTAVPAQTKLADSRPSASRPAYTQWVDDGDAVAIPPSPPLASALHKSPAATRVAPRPAPAAAPTVPVEATVMVERVGLLRRRGNELIRYLGGAAGPVPPIWRSVSAQDQAADLRTRLNSQRVRFAEPGWRITADHASMTTRTQRASAPLQLRAEFAWRDGMWLVESLHTEELQ